MDNDDLKIRQIKEILAVPTCNCTFEKGPDIKKGEEAKDDIFFCSCTPNEFYPMCRDCKNTCHASHPTAFRVKKKYKCMCGLNDHQEILGFPHSTDKKSSCLFCSLYAFTPNTGFFNISDTTGDLKSICSLCNKLCYNSPEGAYYWGQMTNYQCQCNRPEQHDEINILQLESLFKKSAEVFYQNLANFNIHIFCCDPNIEEKLFGVLRNKVSFCFDTQGIDRKSVKALYLNDVVRKIVKLYFLTKGKVKSVSIRQDFLGSSLKDLPKIIGTTFKQEDFKGPEEVMTYTKIKVTFSSFLFNLLVQDIINKKFNKINISTLLNLNFYQRKLYLNNHYNIWKERQSEEWAVITSYVTNFIVMSKAILDLIDNQPDDIGLGKNDVLDKLIKIIKDLIKYNLVEEEDRKTLLVFISDSIDLIKKRACIGNRDAILIYYYSIKAVLFQLVYANDNIIEGHLGQKNANINLPFAFEGKGKSSKGYNYYQLDICAKIFINCIGMADKDWYTPKQRLHFDIYIRKIFEIFAQNQVNNKGSKLKNFYIASLNNSIPYQRRFAEITNSQNDKEIFFNNILSEMHQISEKYYQYSKDMTNFYYYHEMGKSLENIWKLMIADINMIPFAQNLVYFHDDKDVNEIPTKLLGDQANINGIKKFQLCVQKSTFFHELNILLSFLAEEIQFNKCRKEDKNNPYKDISLESLLNILIVSVVGNYPNLSMLMSLNPKNLAIVLGFKISFCQPNLTENIIEFIRFISQMLFSGWMHSPKTSQVDASKDSAEKTKSKSKSRVDMYEYDNYEFFVKFITSFYSDILEKDQHESLQLLGSSSGKLINYVKVYSLLFDITSNFIPVISIANPELVDLLSFVVSHISYKLKPSEITIQAKEYLWFVKKEQTTQMPDYIQFFWNHYFQMLNKLLASDLPYLQVANIESILLIETQEIENLCLNLDIQKKYCNDHLLLSRILMHYITSTMNFPSMKNDNEMAIKIINNLFTQHMLSKQNYRCYHIDDTNFTLLHLVGGADLLKKKLDPRGGNDSYWEELIDENGKKIQILKKAMEYFDEYIQQCKGMTCSESAKVFHIIRYFEYNILNPMFILINHISHYEKSITWTDVKILYDLVTKFYEAAYFLYSELEIFDQKDEQLKNIPSEYHIQIQDIAGIKIRLDERRTLLKEQNNQKNYPKMKLIMRAYRYCLKLICVTENDYPSEEELREMDKTGDSRLKFKVYCQMLSEEKPEEKSDMEAISQKYLAKFIESSECSLLLFQTFQDLANREVYQIVFSFAVKKLFNLTYLNNQLPKFHDYERQVESCNNIRNLNYLTLLNNLLEHDIKFQKCLFMDSENFGKDSMQNLFFLFVMNNVIYCSTKIYEIVGRDEPSQGIAHQMLMEGIQFLIKMSNNQYVEFKQYLYYFQFQNVEQEPRMLDYLPNIPQTQKKQQSGKRKNPLESIKLKFDKKKSELEKTKFSFLNILFGLMRVLTKNLFFRHEYKYLYKNRKSVPYSYYLSFYEQFLSLALNLIKGMTSKENLKMLFQKIVGNVSESLDFFGDHFFFVKFLTGIKDLVGNPNIFDKTSVRVELSIFEILNSLLCNSEGSESENEIATLSTALFPMDHLINTISLYLRLIFVMREQNVEWDEPDYFVKQLTTLNLNELRVRKLTRLFQKGTLEEKDDDALFTRSSQMFLFIKILAENNNYPKAQKIINYAKSDVTASILVSNIPKSLENEQDSRTPKPKKVSDIHTEKGPRVSKLEIHRFFNKTKINVYNKNNNIMASKFFNNIIKKIDLQLPKEIDTSKMIENEIEEEGEEMNPDNENVSIQRVFFILNQKALQISDQSITKFFNEVDRTNPTTKLTGFLESIKTFKNQIDYKQKVWAKSSFMQKMIDFDYITIDKINLFITTLIILSMFFYLKDDSAGGLQPDFLSQFSSYFYFLLYPLAGAQILLNVTMFIVFSMSKFKFYTMLHEDDDEEGKKKSYSRYRYWKRVIIDCFFWNEDTALMTLNLIIAISCFFSRYLVFLFALELFTINKFVPVIGQIAEAFKERFSQFIAMIAFLAILTNFYAMLGFVFMHEQFLMEMGDGSSENVCDSLLTCFILYFNHGVRTGGGVGDLLPELPHQGTIFWIRYFLDYIYYLTVILLLLNMTGGIIVSAFGDIRKDNEKKEEDESSICFICHIHKNQFEKNKLSFRDHIENDHYFQTYLNYFLGLLEKKTKQLSPAEHFVVDCIKNKKIELFPVGRVFGWKKNTFTIVEESNE